MRQIFRCLLPLSAAACFLLPRSTGAQGLTGALIGTVQDAQGGILPGAIVRVSSTALIGGPATVVTNEKGQLRFTALPPGPYVLDISMEGFATYHEEDVRIGAGATIERRFVGGLPGQDDWNKFDVPGLRGISSTAPYFHNNSAATLEDVVDHYIEFFKRVKVNAPPGLVPPVATTDGVHFDRQPLPEEREALLAYLRKL